MSSTTRIKIINEFAKAKDLSFLFDGAVWAYEGGPSSSNQSNGMLSIRFVGESGKKEDPFCDGALAGKLRLSPVNRLWQRLRDEFVPEHGLLDAFASGRPFGDKVDVHHGSNDTVEQFTAIICANSEWKDNWSGEMLFYDESHECVAVRHRPGRLILFGSGIKYVAHPPSQECPDLLKTIVFKTMERVRKPLSGDQKTVAKRSAAAV